jgi:hypothetical protein
MEKGEVNRVVEGEIGIGRDVEQPATSEREHGRGRPKRREVRRRIVPFLPAASHPSNRMTMRSLASYTITS